ncbi:MAG TPA: hypothetical protein VKQ54_05810 [Caulobacteraceae bacterium]|nr:hypothetical protein [Caulobacteraceae bacterium]
MTTPEKLVSRDDPPRGGPIRSGPPPVSQSVADAVRTGYQVVADNVRQGREAAQKFGQGNYNSSNVDKDVKVLTDRMLDLARDLTTTTLDVIERLLLETRSANAGLQAARILAAAGAAAAERPVTTSAAEAPPSSPLKAIALTVRFSGAGADKALDRASLLTRPAVPTEPSAISADPLVTSKEGGQPIGGVSFSACTSVDGVIATIEIPAGQGPGVYSGLVRAPGTVGPVGYLSIEVLG